MAGKARAKGERDYIMMLVFKIRLYNVPESCNFNFLSAMAPCFMFKAKVYAISSDTPITVDQTAPFFKLERFKSI